MIKPGLILVAIVGFVAAGAGVWTLSEPESAEPSVKVEQIGEHVRVSADLSGPLAAVTQTRVVENGGAYVLEYRWICVTEPAQVAQSSNRLQRVEWLVPNADAEAINVELRQDDTIRLSRSELEMLSGEASG